MKLKLGMGSAALILSLAFAAHSAAILLKQFPFDDKAALKEWDRMVLNGRVDYEIVKSGSEGFVQAFSEKACSALYHKIKFEASEYPMLSWRWRALRFPDLSKAKTAKSRDDYAARVYVIFPVMNFTCSRFIEYVWSADLPAGTVITSPYGSNIKMIVLESGRVKDDSWVNESRNVYEDYIRVFGKPPSMKTGAIAIMCDADSTKTVAEAQFDDITIGR